MGKTGTLILLVGLPGAGKSTWSRSHQALNFLTQTTPDEPRETIIIGRDGLRNMLFGYTDETVGQHYKREDFKARENEVTLVQHQLVRQALKDGKTVIVDDINCNLDRLKKWISDYQMYDRTIRFIDTFPEICIRRQENRTRKVSEEVILKMNKDLQKVREAKIPTFYPAYEFKTYIPNKEAPLAVCVDLDGTCSYSPHRSMYDCSEADILADQVIVPVQRLVKALTKANYHIIFLSGRTEKYREATSQWLHTHFKEASGFLNGPELYMRANNDYRKDFVIKQELFYENVAPWWNVFATIDDRLMMVEAWSKMNIFCFNVNTSLTWF